MLEGKKIVVTLDTSNYKLAEAFDKTETYDLIPSNGI